MTLADLVVVAGGTLTGLIAGLLFAFNVAVIPALRSLSAQEHLRAMQAINIRIVSPLFMLSFLGPSVLLPLAAFLFRGSPQFPLLVIAAALHLIGVNGVTIAGNVPLNQQLARVEVDVLSPAEADAQRATYHGTGARWMRLHNLRTVAAAAACALVFIACLAKR